MRRKQRTGSGSGVPEIVGAMEHQDHGGITTQSAFAGYIVPVRGDVSECGGGMNRIDAESETFVVEATPIDMRQASRGATMTNNRSSGSTGGAPGTGIGCPGDAPPITSTDGGGAGVPSIVSRMVVRRLTPVECERLQGFEDGYTAIPYRGKPAADGPRYKALGNSMAVPVMRWIGRRIDAVAVRESCIAAGTFRGGND